MYGMLMIMLSRTFFFFLMLSSCKWWNILINLKARINKIPILIFVSVSSDIVVKEWDATAVAPENASSVVT